MMESDISAIALSFVFIVFILIFKNMGGGYGYELREIKNQLKRIADTLEREVK